MIVATLVILCVAAAAATKPFEGVDPNTLSCDPKGLTYLLLPHCTDCTKFFMCAHGQEVLFSCSGGLIFDFELQGCNWDWDAKCILREKGQGCGNMDSEESSEETEKPDSSEETERPDSSEETERPDTSEETERPDSSQETERPDTSEETERPDTSEETSVETEAPNSSEETSAETEAPEETTTPEWEGSGDIEGSGGEAEWGEGSGAGGEAEWGSGDLDDFIVVTGSPGSEGSGAENSASEEIDDGSENTTEESSEEDTSVIEPQAASVNDGSHGTVQAAPAAIQPLASEEVEDIISTHFTPSNLDCSDPFSAGRAVAYEGDCQRYWRCVNGVAETAYCLDGMLFNERSQQCDFEANVVCIYENNELTNEFIVLK